MRILFQGDSITDANRNRSELTGFNAYGCGYPNFVAGQLCCERPGEYTFIDRAVSGDRVTDLYTRWRKDCIQLRPDVISILIGVNDVWHELGNGNGVPTPRFEKILSMLIDETMEELPGTRFLLMAPFVVNASATKDHWDYFRTEVAERAAAMERVAAARNIPVLRLQPLFDRALTRQPADYWTLDGVHPSHAGHALIAKAWIEAFDRMLG